MCGWATFCLLLRLTLLLSTTSLSLFVTLSYSACASLAAATTITTMTTITIITMPWRHLSHNHLLFGCRHSKRANWRQLCLLPLPPFHFSPPSPLCHSLSVSLRSSLNFRRNDIHLLHSSSYALLLTPFLLSVRPSIHCPRVSTEI